MTNVFFINNRIKKIPTCELLAPYDIDIYELSFDFTNDYDTADCRYLTPTEQQKAASFRNICDKIRFTKTRALLKQLIFNQRYHPYNNAVDASHTTADCVQQVQNITLAYNEFGKPMLTEQDIYFNVTHSEKKALIVLSKQYEIGVDVECKSKAHALRHDLDYLVYADAEHQQKNTTEKMLNFADVWVMKEAVLKAHGTGMYTKMTSFSIEPSDDNIDIYETGTTQKFNVMRHAKLWQDIKLYLLNVEGDYSAAIAIKKLL